MGYANDSILVTPGSGSTVATHSANSKEHAVDIIADSDGILLGTEQAYYLYQAPRVTTAAATDFLDLFNATGSGKILRIRGIFPVITITAANALFTLEFHVIRTSAVGTGGVAHTFEGAAAPSAGNLNIARPSTRLATTLPAQVTSRSLPTGGATAAAFQFSIGVTPEETNPSAYLAAGINWIPVGPAGSQMELQEGQGMKIRQITAVASTGAAFGWLINFSMVP